MAAARAKLNRDIWDYLIGGAETETAVRRNRLALDSLALRPRILRNVGTTDTSGMFLGRKLNKVPVRTYGRLTRNDAGKLVLNYRPWFVLPARTVELPEGNYAIGCGLLYCEIMRAEGADTVLGSTR